MPTEKEIQEYLWEHREDWEQFLDPIALPQKYQFAPDLSDVTASRVLFNRAIDRLAGLDSHVRHLELIGSEVRLEKTKDSTIRADFLGVTPDDPGFTIIELKKPESSTEREAFTQLLGYGNHVATIFPLMSKEDLVYVLIAPMAERIVRDAYVHALLFDGKRVFALQPHFADPNSIATLRLRPWVPPLVDVTRLAEAVFNPAYFEVWKGTWRNTPHIWNVKPGEDVPDWLTERMNQISAYAAQVMESKGIHGFVFSSQLWQELEEDLPFTNALVIVGINPYEAGHALYQIENEDIPQHHVFDINSGEYPFADLFPGVNNKAKAIHDETNYLEFFGPSWAETISELGNDIIRRSIQQTDGNGPEKHISFFSWDDYRKNPLDDVYCTNFDVRPTGILRELYWAVSDLDYQGSRSFSDVGCPMNRALSPSFFGKLAQLRKGRLDRLTAWTPSSNSNRTYARNVSTWSA